MILMEYVLYFRIFRDKKSSIDEKFYSKEFNRNNAFRLSAFELTLYFRVNLMCLYVESNSVQNLDFLGGLRGLNFVF